MSFPGQRRDRKHLAVIQVNEVGESEQALEDPALLKELDEVTAFKGDLVVTERLGIPDEFSVSFGYLHEDGRNRHLRVWEKDASKQNSALVCAQ